jgi:hypothetical protein
MQSEKPIFCLIGNVEKIVQCQFLSCARIFRAGPLAYGIGGGRLQMLSKRGGTEFVLSYN